MEQVISFNILSFILVRYIGSREEESTKTNSIMSASFKLGIYKSLLIEYFSLPKEFKILLYVEVKSTINIKKNIFHVSIRLYSQVTENVCMCMYVCVCVCVCVYACV